jgi:hypothetical protein
VFFNAGDMVIESSCFFVILVFQRDMCTYCRNHIAMTLVFYHDIYKRYDFLDITCSMQMVGHPKTSCENVYTREFKSNQIKKGKY